MAYRISGLDPAPFAPLFALDEARLAARGARIVVATGPGFPCRVSLADASAGERLLLTHHVSHDVATPYRSAYAIYVREQATAAATYRDQPAPVFAGRPLALRLFDDAAMLIGATLAMPGEADARVREALADPRVAYIHAHNAAHGCFSARIDRD